METANKTVIRIESTIDAPVARVWKFYTTPSDITQWNHPSDDWHTTYSENDLRPGGKFLSRMEAKDGSFGFDFGGIYDEVITNRRIAYTIGDGRKVEVDFTENGDKTGIVTNFEAEGINSIEMQKGGWQAILNNFKKYTEGKQ